MRPLAHRYTRRLLFVALALSSSAVFAQTTDSTDQSFSPALDRFSIAIGGYYADTGTTIGAKLNNYNEHGSVNLQNALGFPTHQWEPRVRFDVLIGDHSGLSFDYYRIDESRSKTLSDAVDFDGYTFNGAANIAGQLNFDFGSAAYKWWFGTGSDVFGLGLGAAYYRVHAGIEGSAYVSANGIGSASGATSAYYTEDAWAPQLQLGWRHAFSNNVRMYVNLDGLKKNGGNLYGHIYDGAVGAEWYPWQSVGFGAEYDYTRIKINDEHRSYDDDLALRMNGPTLFVRYRFE